MGGERNVIVNSEPENTGGTPLWPPYLTLLDLVVIVVVIVTLWQAGALTPIFYAFSSWLPRY